MQNVMSSLTPILLAVALLSAPTLVYGQDVEESDSGQFRLVVPLLEGSPAPFSGILMPEADFRLVIEQNAAVERWQSEARVFERQLETERRLYEVFIEEQGTRIDELSVQSWWDENGSLFLFGVGLVLGVVVSAIIVGLASN